MLPNLGSVQDTEDVKLTISFKGHFINDYFIDQDVVIIGSKEDCDLHIDSLAISPKHCSISLRDEALFLEALDEHNPTIIAGEEVQQCKLSNGDKIKLGKHTLTFVCDPNEPMVLRHKHNGGKKQQGCLQIMNGDSLGRIIRLNKPSVKLGKTGSTSALINLKHTGYYLSLLPGGNRAPKVSNREIGTQPFLLTEGDLIEIDGIKMQFFLESE